MKSKWFPLILFLLGGGFIFLGWNRAQPICYSLGAIPLGIAALIWGIDAVKTRYSAYDNSVDGASGISNTYTGLAAVADGFSLILLGLAISILGLIFLFISPDILMNYVKSRPGILLLFGGLLSISSSITHILGAQEENRLSFDLLVSLPKRLFGLLLLILGLGLLTFGGFEVFLPSEFDNLFHRLFDSLTPS